MNKTLKIILNALIFALIIGFGYYMVHSMMSGGKATPSNEEQAEHTLVSPYKKTNSIDVASDVQCFGIYKSAIYAVQTNQISVFDLSGKHQRDFAVKENARDIVVDNATIYLLYPTGIDVYSLAGQKKGAWEACSGNSDYCAFTTTKDYVFVTDAENKNICQYDKQGAFVRFIKSPNGFVIPSYSFGIVSINDTIYCSNSGRQQIESYTLDGTFIDSFGQSGTQVGTFAGCCNPVYLAKTPTDNILTSEKGNPRISSYGKDGKFRSILFDSHTLGGGTTAYRVQAVGDDIYIASKKTISIYSFDATLSEEICGQPCSGCPFRKECGK
jgi:hypothetical protein